jgi:hypothetical protein
MEMQKKISKNGKPKLSGGVREGAGRSPLPTDEQMTYVTVRGIKNKELESLGGRKVVKQQLFNHIKGLLNESK